MAFSSRATLNGDFLHISKDAHVKNLEVTEKFEYLGDLTVSGKTKLKGNAVPPTGAEFLGNTNTVIKKWSEQNGNVIKTSVWLDLTGLASHDNAGSVVARGIVTDSAGVASISNNKHYFLEYDSATMGTLFYGKAICLESPATTTSGFDDGMMGFSTDATIQPAQAFAASAANDVLPSGTFSTSAVGGDVKAMTLPTDTDRKYFYLASAAGTAAVNDYTAGQFIFEFYGEEV